jgi:hypothetical protein
MGVPGKNRRDLDLMLNDWGIRERALIYWITLYLQGSGRSAK